MKEYNAAQSICRPCYDAEDPDHIRSHQFQEIWMCCRDERIETLDQEIERAIRCVQCPGKEIPLAYMSYHPHLSVQLVLGPALLEAVRKISINKCNKVELNKAAARIPENGIKNMTCDFCVSSTSPLCPSHCLVSFATDSI